MLYATLVKNETSYRHIKAFEIVTMNYGLAYSYYVDQHSIFRFVQGRDSNWRKHYKLTDEASPQWKQVLEECGVNIIYALSPQAKGKIERPYRWLQDRLVRNCMRNKVTSIQEAQKILAKEVYEYNHKRVHSTTGDIPIIRFNKALNAGKTLFRRFEVPSPFLSYKDIFCLKMDRTADAYRKISINHEKIKVNKLNPRNKIQLRIYPINKTLSEVRFWRNNELIDVQKMKNEMFKGVHF